MLSISNGKRVKIKLKARTLMSFSGKVVLKKKTIELPSAPLGLKNPVTIPVPVMNIGSNQVCYQLDLADFKANYPHIFRENIISFRNETGQLQPGERQCIFLLFKPNSEERIIATLSLKIKDFFKEMETIKMTVFGHGIINFNANSLNKFFKVEDHVEDEPGSINQPNVPIYFSSGLLDFRNIDPLSIHRRAMFVYNNSQSDFISYRIENLSYFR